MTTGNLAKKRHVEVPSSRGINRTASARKLEATSSYLVRSHTKRNLFNQYNDENVSQFAKPNIQKKRVVSANRKPGVEKFIFEKNPTKTNCLPFFNLQVLANLSANKILKKYRRSSNRRQSSHKEIVSDESLVNYDAFEVSVIQIYLNPNNEAKKNSFQNNIKISQISNSSIVGQRGNLLSQESIIARAMAGSKTFKKNNNYRTKSPLKPSNLGILQTNHNNDLV